MKTKARPRTATTGIAGLDRILAGGLPRNRLYLIKGEPGTGKTTVALQFLLAGVAAGEKSMYITLSETESEIQAVADSHGWDLTGLNIFELSAFEHQLTQEAQNTVFQPAEIELSNTTELLLDQIKESKPQRLVIDSLSELRLLSDSALRYRRQMLAFKQFFAGRAMTVIMLDDHSGSGGGDLHVQSIAHGVLTIDQIETDYGADRRRVKINKMRGLNFLGGYHDAIIEPGGMKVFPRLVASEHKVQYRKRSGLISSGIDQLDALTGGGLDRGTSCLLLGPAGTGKSTVGLQFAVSAADRGEKVVMFLFEESIETLCARARSVGLPVEKYRENGTIELVQIDPAQVAPGQFVATVRTKVEEEKVQVLVVDSLNGYLQAMPDVKFLEIQLHEMLAFLSHHGVLSLMTVAQHGMMGSMHAPVDLTYLADTVILLRYFEESGRIRKAISVLKKRIGRHEDTIREFQISAKGLQVGEPLDAFQGVLTGVPTFRGSPNQMLRKV
jgi:circadian clock protein KaiC